MFSSAVSQIDYIYRFQNLSSKASDCVKSEELKNISSEDRSTQKKTFMTLEHPCHLFSCVMFEQFVIFLTTTLLFIFANVRVLKEFALNYMYAKHTALMSLGKIKPFHTQSQVTQPLVYVTTESSSYANIHYTTIFNDGRSRQIVLLIILFFAF